MHRRIAHDPAFADAFRARLELRLDQGDEFPVRAGLLNAEDKAAVWPRLIEIWPLFDTYVERSGRNLRVFRLVRVPES